MLTAKGHCSKRLLDHPISPWCHSQGTPRSLCCTSRPWAPLWRFSPGLTSHNIHLTLISAPLAILQLTCSADEKPAVILGNPLPCDTTSLVPDYSTLASLSLATLHNILPFHPHCWLFEDVYLSPLLPLHPPTPKHQPSITFVFTTLRPPVLSAADWSHCPLVDFLLWWTLFGLLTRVVTMLTARVTASILVPFYFYVWFLACFVVPSPLSLFAGLPSSSSPNLNPHYYPFLFSLSLLLPLYSTLDPSNYFCVYLVSSCLSFTNLASLTSTVWHVLCWFPHSSSQLGCLSDFLFLLPFGIKFLWSR